MFGVLAYTSLKTLLSKVSLSGETLFMPGGRQSPKMASLDTPAGEHHAIHQEMEFSFPLPCISAGLVTGFAGNSVFSPVQFWSSFEKAASYSHYIQFEFSSLTFVAFVGFGEVYFTTVL